MNKKTRRILGIVIASILLLIGIAFIALNYSKDNKTLSILDKKWIEDNKSKLVDINVFNNIPIYGYEGEGVIFDFLTFVEEDIDLKFNKIPYNVGLVNTPKSLGTIVVGNDVKLKEDAIVLYEDSYVLIGKEDNKIGNINDIANTTIGLLKTDLEQVSYYLNANNNIAYMPYETIDDLISSYDTGIISNMVIPNNLYLNRILASNDKYITFHLSDMSKKYVLSLDIDSDRLKAIIRKEFNKWQDKSLNNSYNTAFNNLYFSAKGILEKEKANFKSKRYIYGYVSNLPYEDYTNNTMIGINSNYLNRFSNLTGVEFTFARFKNYDDLKKSLSEGKIDFAFINYNLSGINVDVVRTKALTDVQYLILTNINNRTPINSVFSLKNKNVFVQDKTLLADYISSNVNATVNSYKELSSALNKIKLADFIVVDADTYNYYRNNYFSKYVIKYSGYLPQDYTFAIRKVSANDTFSSMFSYFVSTVNYDKIRYNYANEISLSNQAILLKTIKYSITLIVLLGSAIFIGIILYRKKKELKIIKKDEKLKYIDLMTSLKNRNYLNQHINEWDNSNVYPQAVIVIDLNNVKYINDNYGHEEGDNLIKSAANILITDQIDHTDIIRTDGNEFLIYMIGYNENEVVAYSRKIFKALKELPHGFGAAIGYSLITDEIKTVDDAINEATLEMRNNKELK